MDACSPSLSVPRVAIFLRNMHLAYRDSLFTSQPEGVEQLAIDGFNDLTQPSQPASPGFGPMNLTALMWGTDHLCPVSGLPVTMQLITCKAFVGQIDALSRSADTVQTRRGKLSRGEKGLGQARV